MPYGQTGFRLKETIDSRKAGGRQTEPSLFLYPKRVVNYVMLNMDQRL